MLLYFACIEMENKDEENIQENSSEETQYPEAGIMQGITEAHNVVRRAHGVDDLIWDEDLVAVSEEWIEHLDNNNNCTMEHNWDSPLGENLFWANYETTNQTVVDSWASEEQHYDYDSNSCAAGEMSLHADRLALNGARWLCHDGVCSWFWFSVDVQL